MEKIYVVPATGLTVINPANGQPLPPEGAEVVRDTYWIRRIDDGDVSVGAAPKKSRTKE